LVQRLAQSLIVTFTFLSKSSIIAISTNSIVKEMNRMTYSITLTNGFVLTVEADTAEEAKAKAIASRGSLGLETRIQSVEEVPATEETN